MSCGSRGGVILRYHYKLKKQGASNFVTNQVTPDATTMSANIGGLHIGQVYEFQVAAVNSAGTGPFTMVTAITIAGMTDTSTGTLPGPLWYDLSRRK